jgi:hypothetical protein
MQVSPLLDSSLPAAPPAPTQNRGEPPQAASSSEELPNCFGSKRKLLYYVYFAIIQYVGSLVKRVRSEEFESEADNGI